MKKPKLRAVLKDFMNRPDPPEGTLSYREMQGFLFAVSCAPEMVMPSEWLPRIFAGEEPPFKSSKEAEAVIGGLMALYNEINHSVLEAGVRLPADCAFRDDLLANFEPGAPVADWCEGFRLGHLWLEESWDDLLPEALENEFSASLLTLTFFTSPALAEAALEEMAVPGKTLEDSARTFRSLFPDALAVYAGMGRAIYEARLQEEGQEAGLARPAAAADLPGRNDPCPCGSGRKYKKCCGRLVH